MAGRGETSENNHCVILRGGKDLVSWPRIILAKVEGFFSLSLDGGVMETGIV
jgi:hypothetical protein